LRATFLALSSSIPRKVYNLTQGMRSEGRRRGGWNYDAPDAPPIPKATRSEIRVRVARRSPSTRNLAPGFLTILLGMLIIVGCVVAFRAIDFKRISVPAAIERINSSIPFHKSAPASEMTPLPAIHNSPDTECNNRQQCTDEEFAGLVDSLRRQWTITPEELRSKCAGDSTYPSLEHCILLGTVSWLDKHPNGEAPWINPKNFDPAIMALCQKDPNLALCLKP
jgi:hypothetical protein